MINKPLMCNLCNGEMQRYAGPRYNRKVGGFLSAFGAFSTFFWTGAIVGVPLFLVGLYMTGSRRQLWVCRDCNTAIERVELRPERKVGKINQQ